MSNLTKIAKSWQYKLGLITGETLPIDDLKAATDIPAFNQVLTAFASEYIDPTDEDALQCITTITEWLSGYLCAYLDMQSDKPDPICTKPKPHIAVSLFDTLLQDLKLTGKRYGDWIKINNEVKIRICLVKDNGIKFEYRKQKTTYSSHPIYNAVELQNYLNIVNTQPDRKNHYTAFITQFLSR